MIDFIERTLEGYEGRNPTSVGSYDTQDIKYFLVTFTKANGSRWRITARVFKRTSIVLIDR